MNKRTKPQIWSINKLLRMNLIIPNYQRPYKWTAKNITDLILDTQKSIDESKKYPNFKYRIGTIILHKDKDTYEIVDGQQRILSFLLLKIYLNPSFTCNLLNTKFTNKNTQKNLHDNYTFIREWFSSTDNTLKNIFKNALNDILEVVVLIVNNIEEAFQLFDSQNTRGKALYPHDLLKAYHLREIQDKYEMKEAVLKWESKRPESIRELFDLYLFPLWNWAKNRKCGNFTTADIDIYKGIREESGYTYARRANKAMPFFILTEPFISGSNFFEMVDHYTLMLHNIKEEIITNPELEPIKMILTDEKGVGSVEQFNQAIKTSSTGLNHAKNLFFCALLFYYDRFHNFDIIAIRKLFTWAMMVRIDMNHLGFATINRYAIGLGDNDRYTNSLPMISIISYARRHTEISSLKINITANGQNWINLYNKLIRLND